MVDHPSQCSGQPDRLETVRQHPEPSPTNTIRIANRSYFQAVYVDRAVTQACIDCPNAHPRSHKTDFAINDVMGGLVIENQLKEM